MDGLHWLEPAEWSAWRLRLKAERAAGNLTALRRDALLELLTLLSSGATPTDAEIARRAGCCAKTVTRARQDARALGLLDWKGTRQMVDGAWRRGPNDYAVRTPGGPVCPREKPSTTRCGGCAAIEQLPPLLSNSPCLRGRPVGLSVLAIKKESKKERGIALTTPRPDALAALEAVRRRREAVLWGGCRTA